MGKQSKIRKVVTVLGSFVLHILSMGVSQSFGVIYKELLSVFEVGEGEIGWIASLFAGLLLGTGLIAGIMVTKIGVSITSVAGSLLMTTGMLASAFVPSPYLLYLTYGVIAGCGSSLLFIAANVVIAEEFTDRRTVAMGIASSGGSVGNIVLPLFTLRCIEIYEWRGSFVLLGALCLQGVVAGALFYNGKKKTTLAKNAETDKALSPAKKCVKYFSFFNFTYVYFVLSATVGIVGYFIPYNLLYSMMTARGQTNEFSSLALSLTGVGSILSRLLIGFFGDYQCCHRIYYLMFSALFSGAISFACVHLTMLWQFLLYGLLYGMGTGVFACLLSVLTMDFVEVEQVGPAFGFLTTVQGFVVCLGTPVAGWLVDSTSSYNSAFYFAGAFFLLAAMFAAIIPLRWRCSSFKRNHFVTYNIEANTNGS